ncbi:glycosyltransferase [Leptolyngbya sp. AN02str]|uniref:glycosyltransferase n=1 Tax=Leptolyngbya sp. AN02str TaxID=3423363 RepID=UPI003D31BF8E
MDDEFWIETRDVVQRYARPSDAMLAPNEFLEVFPQVYSYNVTTVLPAQHFAIAILHKRMLHDVEPTVIWQIVQRFQPIFANSVFAIYAQWQEPVIPTPEPDLFQAVLDHVAAIAPLCQPLASTVACVITTYNRPHSLARSLPQIAALGAPVVVIDDGSSPDHRRHNREIAEAHQAVLLALPQNRGLPTAINTGIGYWLADPSIEWISYFQDDVDVHPELLRVLAQVQDPIARPILTGRDAAEHRTYRRATIGEYSVLLKRSMPGVHLHAHRDYWRGVLPIPTPYLGAPKAVGRKHGQGADEDWWITAWSPQSITKQGKFLVCVPDLVRTFDAAGAASTWQNVGAGNGDRPLTILSSSPSAHTPLEKIAASPPSFAAKLQGLRVLVDGYNLQLPEGTGIKTYSATLVHALQLMGAQVEVLLGRNGNRRDRLLDEVMFFDKQFSKELSPGMAIGVLKGLLKSYLGPLNRPWRRDRLGALVLKEGVFGADFIRYAQSFNLPRCYEIANLSFSWFNRITDVSLSEPMDVWHVTHPLPMRIRNVPKITTIHDLIPLRLPYTTRDNKKVFYGNVRHALRDSHAIITVSEHTKRDLLTFFDADPDRIHVTYQPIAFGPAETDAIALRHTLARYRLIEQQYWLFVGAIEPKKNVGRLLEAYAALDTDMPLVLVGKKAWDWERELSRINDMPPHHSAKWLDYIPSHDLKALYQGAFALVFPSLYEGFGLPPVEAMTLGCPVITSAVSCLPEICGDAALYVNPYDANDIRNKMEQLMGDRTRRQQLIDRGTQQAQRYQMAQYQARLYSAYTQALSR